MLIADCRTRNLLDMCGPVIHFPPPLTLTLPVTLDCLPGSFNSFVFPIGNATSYLAGETYVNVHTMPYPQGEIRGQLKSKCCCPFFRSLFASSATRVPTPPFRGGLVGWGVGGGGWGGGVKGGLVGSLKG
jgi:hypothetical protein